MSVRGRWPREQKTAGIKAQSTGAQGLSSEGLRVVGWGDLVCEGELEVRSVTISQCPWPRTRDSPPQMQHNGRCNEARLGLSGGGGRHQGRPDHGQPQLYDFLAGCPWARPLPLWTSGSSSVKQRSHSSRGVRIRWKAPAQSAWHILSAQ